MDFKLLHLETHRLSPLWFGHFCFVGDGNCALKKKKTLNLHQLNLLCFWLFSSWVKNGQTTHD